MFNVRVKRYLDTEQIQIFSNVIFEKEDRERVKRVNYETGEVVPLNRTVIDNYFDMTKKTSYEGYKYEYPSPEIGINIGNQEENLRRSVRRTKNKIYDITRCNMWEWFFTLTFNPEKVDSYDYEITTKKLSVWLMNMRKKCPDMKYIVVPELHESGRWHFHGLFANVENMEFVDSGKRDRKGRTIYNVGNYKLGYSTATKVEDWKKASSYIAKYVTKEMCAVTSNKKRYWVSRNVDLPVVEEFMVNYGNDELQRIKDIGYISKCKSEYIDVEYLELPIYTTNTNFSKRYRQNSGNQL